MKLRLLFGVLTLLAASFVFTGCDDAYSELVRYTVRTDPLFLDKLGDEPAVPDPPGQLPVLSVADFLDIRNPYYKRNQEAGLVKSNKVLDPHLLSEGDRSTIRKVLDELYGTPAQPKVDGIEDDVRSLLKLSSETLGHGSRHYRVHCLHCHGVTGDGRGPTARWVNPHPRDYRQGRFKFQSVDQTTGPLPPHRDDLLRIIEQGVEGTAMPSFIILPAAERDALASYVIHLSLRGQTEFETIKNSFEFDPNKNALNLKAGVDLEQNVRDYHGLMVANWVKAQSSLIKVPSYPLPNTTEALLDSARRGQTYFLGKYKGAEKEVGKDACVTCHKDYGRQATFRFDEWGTMTRPNNLTLGVYRGGRRPVDIYRRIHSGILPSGMISFGRILPEDKMWDLVNFVQVLGNPNMRKQIGIH